MKNKRPTILFGICLAAFTAYTLLDTFLISSSYQTGTTMNTEMFDEVSASEKTESGKAPDDTTDTDSSDTQTESDDSTHHSHGNGEHSKKRPDGKVHGPHSNNSSSSDTGTTELTVSDDISSIGAYSDDNVSVSVNEYTVNNTQVYVAEVTAVSAEYVKTAFANDTYGKNITDTTSGIAEDNDAILAINGDYYGAREKGYVIRNGVVYRSTSDDEDVLCIYADGSMEVIDPADITAEELVENDVWQAFSFGPGLVKDGQITVSKNDEVGKAMASNPRTAIGMTEDGHYLFVVADGRTDESEGLSLYELADFMQSIGAVCAYNLDGGGSSTMYFNGKVINNPTTSGNSTKERSVSDIVYIK